jgi:hypothetical protein
MAIPPRNPPPRYEPPPRQDGAGPLFESLASAPPRALDPRARGCLMVLGIAAAIGCIASAGIVMSCPGCMQIGESQAIRQITGAYRTAAAGAGEADTDEPALHALEGLGDTGSITLLAFGILSNRYQDALANDGRIDVVELHRGMELVHDIVDGQGTIVLDRYPEGR